jgi:lipopolysaccharide export system permease protein
MIHYRRRGSQSTAFARLTRCAVCRRIPAINARARLEFGRMKLIDKYLLREYLFPVTYCFLGLLMLYLVFGLMEYSGDLVKSGATFSQVVRFFGYFMVAYADGNNISFMVFMLPGALLGGTLYGLYKLTRHNELTAMRASGVSLFRLICPFIWVGVACSLLAVGIQEYLAPGASRAFDEIERELSGDPDSGRRVIHGYKYNNVKGMRHWRIDVFDTADPSVLVGIELTRERLDTSRISVIRADRADWKDGRWVFHGMRRQKYLHTDLPDGPEEGPYEVPRGVDDLTETPDDFLFAADGTQLERYHSSLAVLFYLKEKGNADKTELARQKVDLHTRLAMPWACLIVGLLSVPIGAKGGRQGMFAGIITAVVLFLLFFLTMQFGAFLGKRQNLPAWLAAWLPNVVFFLVGTGMILRMRR